MVEIPPISLKHQVSFHKNHSLKSCAVAVVYCIYDKRRKTIVNQGTSRACGENYGKISIHAEERCISYCRTNDKRNNYEIYIWRYSKEGKIKPVYCCYNCCKLLNKYKYSDRIFTFENNQKCIATGKPYETIGSIIKKQN